MVESQKEAFLASQQPLSDDDSTGASNNMSRLQINELVEKVIFFSILIFVLILYLLILYFFLLLYFTNLNFF